MLLLLVLNPYTDLVRERGIVWVCAHVNNNKIKGRQSNSIKWNLVINGYIYLVYGIINFSQLLVTY